MAVGLVRASTYALKKETTTGEYIAPTSGAEFVALRPKNELSFEPEILSSDELLNDIGEAKGSIGKQAVKGSHSAYLKHSGVEGQEPELGIMYESLMGAKYVASVEYATSGGATTTVLVVGSGIGANFQVGQPVLIKDATNGYSIRNISSISGDSLSLNFKLSAAPGSAVSLGKAILYKPASQGHPTFSVTKYLGSGYAIESSAGNTTTDLSIKADANKFAEADFSFEGTKYLYNAIKVTATNKYLDFTDDQGTQVAVIAEGTYATPVDLATAIQLALDAASTETMVCTYSSSTGKFTISSGSLVFSLLFGTGANAANEIAQTIGFTATNKTGAVTYTSDNELSYAASLTPSYDAGDLIVMKGAELFVGSQTDNACICAQTVAIKVSKKVADVDCICEVTGVKEKIPTSRTAEITVSATLQKHEAALLSALLKASSVSAMLNAGSKNAGNWIAGQCFNAYMKSATVSSFKTGGDSFISVEITLKGYVTSTDKDIYLGFV